jgi:hypothetical protein
MRKRWEQRQRCGQRCSALDKVMISPSVSKVNPFHLADFAALRDCSVAHPTCHNLLMCGRYRLSRRKQIVEEYLARFHENRSIFYVP